MLFNVKHLTSISALPLQHVQYYTNNYIFLEVKPLPLVLFEYIRYQNTSVHKIGTDAGRGTSHASLYDRKFVLADTFLLFLEALTRRFVVCKRGRTKKMGKTTKKKRAHTWS